MTSHGRRPAAPKGGAVAAPDPGPVTFGGTLGALAVVAGVVAIGTYMLDLHGHTCDKCGRRWRHFGAFNLGDADSHTCSRCGEVQWWKCGAPHVMRGSQFVERNGVSVEPSQEALRPAFAPPGVAAIPAAFPGAFAGASPGLPSGTVAPSPALPSPTLALAGRRSR